MTDLPPPPNTPALTWRPHIVADAEALFHLELDCAKVDGRSDPHTPTKYQSKLAADTHLADHSWCAFDQTGRLAATAWVIMSVMVGEFRAFLNGRIHPHYRQQGLGTYILSWMESLALNQYQQHKNGRICRLRCDYYDRGPDAVKLYQQQGYHFSHAEDIMSYPLNQPILDFPLPTSWQLTTWNEDKARQTAFHEVYVAAFQERLGDKPAWSLDKWCQAMATGDEFRPEFSLLLHKQDTYSAYVMCSVEPDSNEGWIDQIGVHPQWRGQGFARFLLAEALRRFQADGLQTGTLSVNINNPQARRVYDRFGFQHMQRYSSYQKIIFGH